MGLVSDIYANEERAEEHRPHLGGSVIGRECERAIWYSFRWVYKEQFSGRMLRLFRRGQNEEEHLIKALESVGLKIEDEQKRVEINIHFGGSIDGRSSGHLLEFKTHNHKSFLSLTKQTEKSYKENKEKVFDSGSVQDSKPQHFMQMQLYMGGLGLKKALYVAVNKNDDALYIEEVEFNKDIFEGLKDKGDRVVYSYGIPPQAFTPGKMSPCGFCEFKGVCHEDQELEVNCRTCRFSVPEIDGWKCDKKNEMITTEQQRKGCSHYDKISSS